MDKIIEKTSFDEERALYGSENLKLKEVAFEGAADGESALKESKNIEAVACDFKLRYPLWHDDCVILDKCNMSETCRAALWYSTRVMIKESRLGGIKAVRECRRVSVDKCEINSPEFGWFTEDIKISESRITSEYFLLKSKNVSLFNTQFNGKYSFQYVEGGLVQDCTLNTKDAFWHAKNIRVKNCRVIGEYLAWYSEDLVFENCEISGTQPFCYCKNVTLINCTMTGCDLAFEKSVVNAQVTTKIDSVKNPYGGKIRAPEVGEVILTDPNAKGKLEIG